MKFNLKGYYDTTFFEFNLKPAVFLEGFDYIQFSSLEAQKTILHFFREEMQQGQNITTINLGRRFIEQTGYFDLASARLSWEEFRRTVNPFVLYSFEIQNGVVFLNPINIRLNSEIKASRVNILEL